MREGAAEPEPEFRGGSRGDHVSLRARGEALPLPLTDHLMHSASDTGHWQGPGWVRSGFYVRPFHGNARVCVHWGSGIRKCAAWRTRLLLHRSS